jgi:methionyl aminopeptidase
MNVFTDELELNCMRAAGELAASVLDMIEFYIKPGVTTNELDKRCHDFILQNGAIPAPLNYTAGDTLPPFPKSICTSLNQVVCHGIPSDKKLKKGDMLNIDVTVILNGYHGDTSKMFFVGKVPSHAERLARIAQECLYAGIRVVRPGTTIGDIGHAIETIANKENVSIVREYGGHGIGTIFHDAPHIRHYGSPGTGETLQVGQCFTIEPMINAGKRNVRVLGDKWTVVTKDRRLSAQWEHTILVTPNGHEVLTLRVDETI